MSTYKRKEKYIWSKGAVKVTHEYRILQQNTARMKYSVVLHKKDITVLCSHMLLVTAYSYADWRDSRTHTHARLNLSVLKLDM